jgi:hypothetical protein
MSDSKKEKPDESVPLEEQNKNRNKYESDVNELWEDAIELIKKEMFDDGIDLYKQILEIVKAHPWGIIAFKVEDQLQNAIQKQKEILERKQREIEAQQLKKLKEEEEAKLMAARDRLKQKELSEKEQKMQAIQKRKQKENENSTKAYNLLEQGTNLAKSKDFSTAIQIYEEAKKLFEEINWQSEASRVVESLNDIKQQNKKHMELLERERLEREKLDAELKKQAEVIEKTQLTQQLKSKEDAEKSKKESDSVKTKKDMEAIALRKIDEGNALLKAYNFDGSIEKLREAKDIFTKIGWVNEADNVILSIEKTKHQQEVYFNKIQREKSFESQKKQEEEDLRKQLELQRRVKEREEQEKAQKSQDESQKKKKDYEVSKQALAMIQEMEKIVAVYKEKASMKDFSQSCPYEQARNTYYEARNMFKQIGWNDEAEKINASIALYENLMITDLKIREFERKKKEEKLHEELDFKETIERERKNHEMKERAKQEEYKKQEKLQEEIEAKQKAAFVKLEKGNALVKEFNFDQAENLYREALMIFEQISWRQGAELTRDALVNMKREQDKYERTQAEKIRSVEDAEKAKRELEKQIQMAKSDDERQKIEMKQKALDSKLKKDREEQVHNEIILLLQEGSELIQKFEFESGIAKYEKTLPLFNEISWDVKKVQVVDMIQTAKAKHQDYIARIQHDKELNIKKKTEQEEMERKIKESQEEDKRKQKEAQEQQKKMLSKDKRERELKEQAFSELDRANVAIDRGRFQNAMANLETALIAFKELGWEREIKATEVKIAELNKRIQDSFKPTEKSASETEKNISDKAYAEIDVADKEVRLKRYQEAMTHLLEAKKLFTQIKWSKAIVMVDQRITDTELQIKQKEDSMGNIRKEKAKKTEEEAYKLLEEVQRDRSLHKFIDAFNKATQAQNIFIELGWAKEAKDLQRMIDDISIEVKEHESQMSQGEKDRQAKLLKDQEDEEKLKKIIAERRAKRREERQNL